MVRTSLGLAILLGILLTASSCDLLKRLEKPNEKEGECSAEGNSYGTEDADYVLSCKRDGKPLTVRLRNARRNTSAAKQYAEFQCSATDCAVVSEIQHGK